MYIYMYIHTYMVFTTEGFLEVAIESWPEWDLNPWGKGGGGQLLVTHPFFEFLQVIPPPLF